jgi:putative N6-adenine-specific DNA methylase
VVVQLFWKGERGWLYLNTSGQKLSDRSYRKIPYQAPLREVLAAGLIQATGYDGTTPFVNPMCGSGTLAIEAALLATGRAPGLLRANFGFMHLKLFDEALWQTARKEARKRRKKTAPAPIVATDVDAGAVEAARKNAKTAGVDHLITFAVCDFAETPLPEEKGIIVLNPGYGKRLGAAAELEETYRRIGHFLKQKGQGHRGYIFTGSRRLAKSVGLRPGRRIPFLNGSIECQLLEYELY